MRFVIKYVARHMCRAFAKTAIAFALAAVIAGACGFLAMTRQSYRDMFDALEVAGTLNFFSSQVILEAERSPLIESLYYSGGYIVIANGIFAPLGYTLAVTNDIDRYIQGKSEAGYTVKYSEGHTSDMFSKVDGDGQSIVIGSVLAEMLDAPLGGSVELLSWEFANLLLMMAPEDFFSKVIEYSGSFCVAGIVESDDMDIALGVFAPISKAVERISPLPDTPFSIEYCKFTIANKEETNELLRYIEELSMFERNYPDTPAYHIDFTELENTHRVRDQLNAFFPVALAAAIALGLAAPTLVILNSAKEAACLRMLGTTKKRVYCIFAAPQIMLCFFGMALASLTLMVYNYGAFARSADTLILCGALILGGNALAAILSGVILTRKDIFRLLQARE